MKRIFFTFFIVPVIILFTNDKNIELSLPVDEIRELAYDANKEWEINYNATIEYIKDHEGFNGGKAYRCTAGYLTIGYGHVVKEGEYFEGNVISPEAADRLLREDFNTSIELVEKFTDLKGNKKLAIAHFVFSKGIGNFLRSTLKKKIDNGEPIDDEILKWCYYTTPNGKKIKSEYSYKIRQWELEMYNTSR